MEAGEEPGFWTVSWNELKSGRMKEHSSRNILKGTLSGNILSEQLSRTSLKEFCVTGDTTFALK